MSETATRLLEQLLSLPDAERAEIADRLWASLPDGVGASVTDYPAFRTEMAAELERRRTARGH
ncbi:MAG: hypothetical protein C0501_18195 [Isosphaera sp.]|nr:hypothetical protein [Isosphaera sp.]